MSDTRIKITLVLGQDDLTTIKRSQQLAQIIVGAKSGAASVARAGSVERVRAGERAESVGAVKPSTVCKSATDSVITIVLKAPEVKPQMQGLCLCCRMHTELSDLLREAFMQAIQRKRPPFSHVLVCARHDTDPANIVHTLTNDFFLKERFVYQDAVYLMGEEEQGMFSVEREDDEQGIVLPSNARHQLLAADLILLDGVDASVVGETLGGVLAGESLGEDKVAGQLPSGNSAWSIEQLKTYLQEENKSNSNWQEPMIVEFDKLTEDFYRTYLKAVAQNSGVQRISHRTRSLFG